MLINRTYDKDAIVSFKLVNGDEIIAKVIEETDRAYLISKPCTVMPGPRGLGLMQTIITSDLDKNLALDKNHVMLHSITHRDVESHYIQTTTGLATAGTGKIIT